MSDTLENMRRQIDGAGELRSVVRTMKALAAASIGQYETAVRSLRDYDRAVQLGLAACFRGTGAAREVSGERGTTGAIVFGSDQGLVGQFNESLAGYAARILLTPPGGITIWAVGEQVRTRLADAGLPAAATFPVPNLVSAIAPLLDQILVGIESQHAAGQLVQVYLFHNRRRFGAAYEPACLRLLPLDATWQNQLREIRWPTANLPEVLNGGEPTMRALVREYLFVALFRACAESLASENASRLAAMQRAEKNINKWLEDLSRTFHRVRQSSIDEELFDLFSGFEALGAIRQHACLNLPPCPAT